jgi:PTS system mannitol-specific IIC component
MKERIQRFGGFLAGMVIPNIGAFIAWGFITAFFIPVGWTPSEKFGALVGPMILNLLPILIGYTGGKLVHGVRGGVVGAIATMGVVVGAEIPQFMGAMIMGPLGGFLIKQFDNAVEDSIPSGFEMLVNNFSAGILGMLLAMLGLIAIGPAVEVVSAVLGSGVQWLVDRRLLPLADLIIEPAKVLFLNNAINHGVLTPLGVAEVTEKGRSILFLLETNPGPGLGLLLAYWFAGKGMAKESAPGAIIIHFLGGIHEIYFPYVLMHPIMIVAMWAGGISADAWFMLTGAGLVATPSPGSIFAELAMTPRGAHIGVIGGILVGTAASFLVGSVLLKAFPVREDEEEGEEIASTSPVAVPASK